MPPGGGAMQTREVTCKSMAGPVGEDRGRGRSQNQELAKKRPCSLNEWQRRVAYALRHFGDRSVLNRSPLARLAHIERLAAEQYSGRLLPRGLALHDTLSACVDKVLTELNDEPALARACTYLQLLLQDKTCREISRQLGLSREHVSRLYRKRALELVTEEFRSTVRNSGKPSLAPRGTPS